jgi:zinc-binding alcohol dehydrogenase/oxidoreductase
MRAIVLSEHGGPEVLRAQDVPDPQGKPGHVVVELRAAALNWHDVLLRRGVYPFPLPVVPGSDGAGVLTGTDERVMVLPSLAWGDDDRFPAPGWSILGDLVDGTYAERVLLPRANAVPIPDGWSFEEAAALPLAGLTAFRALLTRGGLVPGETVLVLGAGGGVASIAIGLARIAGARVFVTTSSAEKLELARELGADGGVLYTEEDWPAQVRELAGESGVDLVVDSVGSTWQQALECTNPGGRVVTFGATGAGETTVDVRRFYFAQQTILGTTMGSPRDFAGLLELLRHEPGWRPRIDRTFGLEDAAAAHAAMERREHTGKLVLAV